MSGHSKLEEKLGAVQSSHEWGRWWQTLEDIQVEVDLPAGTKAKQLKVLILPSSLELSLLGDILIKGPLFGIVHADESTWTVEQNKLLRIIMPKADYSSTNIFLWKSLFKDQWALDNEALGKTEELLELQRMKIENPAFDFSKFSRIPRT